MPKVLSLPIVGSVFAISLAVLGLLLDDARPLSQPALFTGLQLASLGGAGLGLALTFQLAGEQARPGPFALAALLGWRLALSEYRRWRYRRRRQASMDPSK